MKWAFWISAAVIGYTYLGYPAWLWLRGRWHPRPVQCGTYHASVSILMVVRNEAVVLEEKLQNLLQLHYPSEQWEIVVVSDGPTDRTAEILGDHVGDPRLRVALNALSRGKAACLNDAMKVAQGEILIFTDARQKIEPDAIRVLVQNFADPDIGCVSGELMLGNPDSGESAKGLGFYWGVEKTIREMESESGSVVGATGALYAVRRSLVSELPPETVLDDVYIPMHVVRQGSRVVFEPRARAWDKPDMGRREFARKVRTLGGNYQLLQLAPWLLTAQNPIRFEFVSHKLLRLLVPFALAAALVASSILLQPVYRIALAAQLMFYALSLLAAARLKRGPLARAADVAWTFVLLNTAALVAFANFVTGRKAAWSR